MDRCNHCSTKIDNFPLAVENSEDVLYFCKTHGSTLWHLPEKEPLCAEVDHLLAPWKNETITLYTKVVEPKQVTEAYLCATKLETVDYYTNLLGDKFMDLHTLINPVLPGDCQDFVKYKTCSEGHLTRTSGSLYTTNKALKIEFPGAFAGFFKGNQHDEKTNCLLETPTIFYRPNTLEMFSPIYDLKSCSFTQGNCQVNNMTLIWIPQCDKGWCKKCHYTKAETITGAYSGRAFLSHDKTIGDAVSLTFPLNPKQILSCEGHLLRMSEQGLAIPEEDFLRMNKTESRGRNKRETATTEELASELTSVELRLTQLLEHMFAIQCRNNVRETNPTLMARKWLKRMDVMAKYRTDRLLEVFPCSVVDNTQIELRTIEDECYKYVAISIQIPDIGWTKAFLDPTLSIISTTSPVADCRTHRYHILR